MIGSSALAHGFNPLGTNWFFEAYFGRPVPVSTGQVLMVKKVVKPVKTKAGTIPLPVPIITQILTPATAPEPARVAAARATAVQALTPTRVTKPKAPARDLDPYGVYTEPWKDRPDGKVIPGRFRVVHKGRLIYWWKVPQNLRRQSPLYAKARQLMQRRKTWLKNNGYELISGTWTKTNGVGAEPEDTTKWVTYGAYAIGALALISMFTGKGKLTRKTITSSYAK